jgi:hypothetical protein
MAERAREEQATAARRTLEPAMRAEVPLQTRAPAPVAAPAALPRAAEGPPAASPVAVAACLARRRRADYRQWRQPPRWGSSRDGVAARERKRVPNQRIEVDDTEAARAASVSRLVFAFRLRRRC